MRIPRVHHVCTSVKKSIDLKASSEMNEMDGCVSERDTRGGWRGGDPRLEEAQEKSRAGGKKSTGPTLLFEAEATAWLAKNGVTATDDAAKYAMGRGSKSAHSPIHPITRLCEPIA